MSTSIGLAAGLAFALVAAVFLAANAGGGSSSYSAWDATRAAGITAFVFLTAALAGGLSSHLRWRPAAIGGPAWLHLHRLASAMALAFTAAHLAALLLDGYFAFSPLDLAVGFTAPYQPTALALGSAAMWLLAVVVASTALSGRLGAAAWRRLHLLALPCWLLALVHGLLAVSDPGPPFLVPILAAGAMTIAALGTARVFGRGWA